MLTINISELLLTILSFFILMLLLDRLLFRPVISFREQRQKRIDQCYEKERAAKEELGRKEKELSCRRADSLKEAESIVAAARSQAQDEADQAEKQAQLGVNEKLRQAEEEARKLADQGSKALEPQCRRLAESLADRLCS